MAQSPELIQIPRGKYSATGRFPSLSQQIAADFCKVRSEWLFVAWRRIVSDLLLSAELDCCPVYTAIFQTGFIRAPNVSFWERLGFLDIPS